MKVEDAIEILKTFDPNRPLCISAEGDLYDIDSICSNGETDQETTEVLIFVDD
jgi:hypothetical protein